MFLKANQNNRLCQSILCSNSEKFRTLWKNPFFEPYDKYMFFKEEYYSLI